MAKAIECDVVCYTRWGYTMTPYHAKSIAEAVRWAKENGTWRYHVICNGKIVRRGYCEG